MCRRNGGILTHADCSWAWQQCCRAGNHSNVHSTRRPIRAALAHSDLDEVVRQTLKWNKTYINPFRWPGALAFTATHAIVYAQLIIPSPSGPKNHGIHPFVMQVSL